MKLYPTKGVMSNHFWTGKKANGLFSDMYPYLITVKKVRIHTVAKQTKKT